MTLGQSLERAIADVADGAAIRRLALRRFTVMLIAPYGSSWEHSQRAPSREISIVRDRRVGID